MIYGWYRRSTSVDTRDVLTVVVAIAVVAVIALVFRYPAGIPAPSTTPPPTTIPATVEPTGTVPLPPATPETHLPVKIPYTSAYFSYPVHHLPDNMRIFGASDPIWFQEEMVTFAYLEESGGGLSRLFVVPYPRWQINYTMDAELHPGSALLQWVLVNAGTGEVVDGGELRTEAREIKRILVSGEEMYFILRVQGAERVYLALEAPRAMVTGTEETILVR
jgi:hypothetical protein